MNDGTPQKWDSVTTKEFETYRNEAQTSRKGNDLLENEWQCIEIKQFYNERKK